MRVAYFLRSVHLAKCCSPVGPRSITLSTAFHHYLARRDRERGNCRLYDANGLDDEPVSLTRRPAHHLLIRSLLFQLVTDDQI